MKKQQLKTKKIFQGKFLKNGRKMSFLVLAAIFLVVGVATFSYVFGSKLFPNSKTIASNLDSYGKYSGTNDSKDGIALSACASAYIDSLSPATTNSNNVYSKGQTITISGHGTNEYPVGLSIGDRLWRLGTVSSVGTNVPTTPPNAPYTDSININSNTYPFGPYVAYYMVESSHDPSGTGNFQWSPWVSRSFDIGPKLTVNVAGTGKVTSNAFTKTTPGGTANLIVATVYQNCGYNSMYTGYSAGLTVGTYTLAQLKSLGILDNDLSSIEVTSGYKVTLYDGDNFTGSSVTETANDNCFVYSNGFNDMATSIKVESVGGSGTTPYASAIDCSNGGSAADCVRILKNLETVNLVAQPSSGYTFQKWSGGPCDGSTSPTCSFSINNDYTVSAVFSSIASCGNGACDGIENCVNCPSDCGTCPIPPVCGDGTCNGTETCDTCPDDCGVCRRDWKEVAP